MRIVRGLMVQQLIGGRILCRGAGPPIKEVGSSGKSLRPVCCSGCAACVRLSRFGERYRGKITVGEYLVRRTEKSDYC